MASTCRYKTDRAVQTPRCLRLRGSLVNSTATATPSGARPETISGRLVRLRRLKAPHRATLLKNDDMLIGGRQRPVGERHVGIIIGRIAVSAARAGRGPRAQDTDEDAIDPSRRGCPQ